MPPFFSVIIPTYNQDKFLSKALDSLNNQTYKNFETIIIDNYSVDNTEKIVNRFEKKKIYKKIKNLGVIAKSRNVGIRLAKGKWLAFLDTDDFWTHNKLKEVYDEIEKKNFDVFCNSEWILNEKIKKKLWIYGHYSKLNFYKKLLFFGNCLSTSATVINKNFLERKKIFYNENKKFVTSEDYEFFLNIANKGGKFHFYKKPLGYHLFHEKSASANRNNHFNSILEVQKFHVFQIQDFTLNKTCIWKKVKKISLIQEDIKNLISNKNLSFKKIFNTFTRFFFNPLKFSQIMFFFLKKSFIQRIYFFIYR